MKILRQVLFNFTFILFLAAISTETLCAQVVLTGEIRPRTEIRHGFKTLPSTNDDPAFFTEQRTRLLLSSSGETNEIRISVQDVRIWGSESQLSKSDNFFSVHEAWGKLAIGSRSFIKAGRQELVYDDERILGNVNWTAQGRSHDAVVGGTRINNWDIHFGLAYNQDNENPEPVKLFDTYYSVQNNYKALQYLWAGKDFDKVSASFLILNNGLQAPDSTVNYSRTFGFNLNYTPLDNITIRSSFYYQSGKDRAHRNIAAYLGSLNTTFSIGSSLQLTTGADYLSGSGPDDHKNHSFDPLYGTHHAFYGFMDYFYVGHPHKHRNGTSSNNAGLIDLYQKFALQLFSETVLRVHIHNFFSPVSITDPEVPDRTLASRLGTELDLVLSHQINKEVSFHAGYSQMLATASLETLKGGDHTLFAAWGWIMLRFNPTLFTNKL